MTTIHVSKNDPSAFSTLQEAILSIDDRHDETIRIEVAPGIYEEKLFIRKENIEIVGDDPLMTVFRYGDGAKKPRPDGSGEYGTFNLDSRINMTRLVPQLRVLHKSQPA